MPHFAEAVRDFVSDRSLYYPCLILVGEQIERLDAAATRLASENQWPRLNLGRELSAALLGMTERQRPEKAPAALFYLVHEQPAGIVIVTGIDLLFEPSLALDPLTLLLRASRRRPLVVLWPGAVTEATLAYATREHAHYRTWTRSNIQSCRIHSLADLT